MSKRLRPEPIVTGEDVKRIRTRLGWSQRKLAAHLGTYQPNVHNWEHGKNFPSTYDMIAKLQALDTEESQ